MFAERFFFSAYSPNYTLQALLFSQLVSSSVHLPFSYFFLPCSFYCISIIIYCYSSTHCKNSFVHKMNVEWKISESIMAFFVIIIIIIIDFVIMLNELISTCVSIDTRTFHTLIHTHIMFIKNSIYAYFEHITSIKYQKKKWCGQFY